MPSSSFTNINLFSSFLMIQFSKCLTIRRGYSVASETAAKGGVAAMNSRYTTPTPTSEEVKRVSNNHNNFSWMPDPVTGFYKPEHNNEIDVADLRAKLLPKKFNN